MTDNLNQLTIQEARKGLKAKKFSATELTRACLEQVRLYDGKLNAFLTVDETEALVQAKKIDQNYQGRPLEGIPIALKDLYVTESHKTTAGSRVLKDYQPQYDATVVKRLKEAGVVILGKLNEDAWGHGASGENSAFGATHNPWDSQRVAGGSSSGPGAAVAAGMCLAAGGTDTGGSVRNPASLCGIVGLKPTYGRVSRYGIVAMASSLDCIGHLTRSVWDAAWYLQVSAGTDNNDATTPPVKVPRYTEKLTKFSLKNLKIGLPKEYFVKGVNQEVKRAIEKAAQLLELEGARVTEISLPHTEYGVASYYLIMSSETSSNLARYDGMRFGNPRKAFGNEAKRRIMLGTYALSAGYYEAYYRKAMQVRTLIRQDFEKAFKKADVLITPVLPTPAFKIGEKQTPLEMYLADIFTIPASLVGVPALSVPCGFTKSNLPVGMQLIGPQFREDLLFQVGYAYEQLTDWHLRKPNLLQIKNPRPRQGGAEGGQKSKIKNAKKE